MKTIYEQHDAAFARVSAWVVTDTRGERVATVAVKYPADGAGRVHAYLHVIGTPMVRGWAGGYGYDKTSAAVASAAERWTPRPGPSGCTDLEPHERDARERAAPIIRALRMADGSKDWKTLLECAGACGYHVLQAV